MKWKKKTKLELIQDKTQNAINETNKNIEKLGEYTIDLYDTLTSIQELFDKIRNVPNEEKLQYESYKKQRLNWKQQAERIEKDYKDAVVKDVSAGAAGAGLGVAVVTMGPTVAMGIATTFGVASTGTAISALSGAAATNAALAWLGGGTIAMGGAGMAGGEAFLMMAGPVGWAIAGVSLVASCALLLKSKNEKKRLENVFMLISERDIRSYELAIVELKERMTRIVNETEKINLAIEKIKTFGLDYNSMTEAQQYELGAYVNLMYATTQLLTNPIIGLMPKYATEDYEKFLSSKDKKDDRYKGAIISLANLLYKIELDKSDVKLLYKSFRNNKNLLKSMNISKKEFDSNIMKEVFDALDYKYASSSKKDFRIVIWSLLV